MAERGIHAAAPFPRRSQDHVRVILAEPIVQTGAVHMAGAWFIAGMGRISIKERNTTMASDCLCSMVLRPVERLVFSPKER